jgi:hypothetical protein
MRKPRVTLLLSGQIERNLITNDFLEIIEFHRKIFKFDNIICHLWNEEYEKIKHLQIPEYIKIINDDDSLPFNQDLGIFVSKEELDYHAESVLISLKLKEVYDTDHTMASAIATLRQSYALNRIYNYALENSDSDIFIRVRYDNHYIFSPNYSELNEYLSSSRPVIFVPRSHINYALPDICYFMNRAALEKFKDYFNTCRNYSFNNRVFWSEICLRFHINNATKMILYRFNFPCYVQRWFKDMGDFNCRDFQLTKITRDVKPFKPIGMRSADYIL